MVTTPIKTIFKVPGKIVGAIAGKDYHHPQPHESSAPDEKPRKSGRIDKMLFR